jgi:hypothetical protein
MTQTRRYRRTTEVSDGIPPPLTQDKHQNCERRYPVRWTDWFDNMSYKLAPEQRDEVNALIEEDDIEGVLFRLVGQREELREALLSLRDEQNGAPLETRRQQWESAMAEADRLLSNE